MKTPRYFWTKGDGVQILQDLTNRGGATVENVRRVVEGLKAAGYDTVTEAGVYTAYQRYSHRESPNKLAKAFEQVQDIMIDVIGENLKNSLAEKDAKIKSLESDLAKCQSTIEELKRESESSIRRFEERARRAAGVVHGE